MYYTFQTDFFIERVFADYHFLINRIFAHIAMDERDYNLYNNVASPLEKNITNPDLIVCLQSNVQRLMYNIQLRDRQYERNIDKEYIYFLAEAYNRYFTRYNESPLLVINNTAKLNFISYLEQFDKIAELILNASEGTSRYAPDMSC